MWRRTKPGLPFLSKRGLKLSRSNRTRTTPARASLSHEAVSYPRRIPCSIGDRVGACKSITAASDMSLRWTTLDQSLQLTIPWLAGLSSRVQLLYDEGRREK